MAAPWLMDDRGDNSKAPANEKITNRVREGWRVGGNLAVPKYYFLTGTILVIE